MRRRCGGRKSGRFRVGREVSGGERGIGGWGRRVGGDGAKSGRESNLFHTYIRK